MGEEELDAKDVLIRTVALRLGPEGREPSFVDDEATVDRVLDAMRATIGDVHEGPYRCLPEWPVTLVLDDGREVNAGFCSLAEPHHWHLARHTDSWTRTFTLGPELARVVTAAVAGSSGARVVGVGAIFVPCADPEKLAAWYTEHLGLAFRKDSDGNQCADLFARDDEEPSRRVETAVTFVRAEAPAKGFMVNYRVKGFDAVVERLRARGVTVETAAYPFGRFAWFHDPAGNKVEVYEPA